jgi:hypothetical protein
MLFSYRRFRRNYLRPFLLFLFLVFLIDAIRISHRRPDTYRTKVADVSRRSGDNGPPANTTVFIASVHRNTEPLLREAWADSVLGLVDYFGPENVYFSAVESGSQDNTKAALWDLKA